MKRERAQTNKKELAKLGQKSFHSKRESLRWRATQHGWFIFRSKVENCAILVVATQITKSKY